jgi:hypothetical protein
VHARLPAGDDQVEPHAAAADPDVAGAKAGAAAAVVDREQEPSRQGGHGGVGQQAAVKGVNQRPELRTTAEAGQRAGGDVAGPVMGRRGQQPLGGGLPAQRAGVAGPHPAELDVPAGGEVDPAVPEATGQPGDGAQARGGDVAARQPHAGHLAVAGLVQVQDARAGVDARHRTSLGIVHPADGGRTVPAAAVHGQRGPDRPS